MAKRERTPPRGERRRALPIVHLALPILALLLAILPGILHAERACEPDSSRYLALGQRLLTRGCYCNDDGSPHATTPPLYPTLAAVATIGRPSEMAVMLPTPSRV